MRVDGAGNQVWPGSPIAVCSVLSSKSRLDVAQAANGSALLVWSDGRHDGGDIFSQNVQTNGTLGVPPCHADVNHDGLVNSQDYFDFVSAFFAGVPAADFNEDGVINSQDFFDFVSAFFAGCS
jgi:hypothetical protein